MNKKMLFGLLAAFIMLFVTSCSNDELNSAQSGDEAQVTFSLGLEGGIGSRTISDGKKINKLVYAVYKLDAKTNKPVLQKVTGSNENSQFVTTGEFQNLTQQVSVTLAKGQTYQVAFWAQHESCGAYNTDDLTNVTISYDDLNNDETRDAFFKMEEFEVSGNHTIDVVLKRPFAQINVGVTDTDWTDAVNSGIEIKNSSVKIKNVADQINLLTGEVSASDEVPADGVTYSLNEIPNETLKVETDASNDGKEEYRWLSMSYILVNDTHESDDDEDGTLGDARTTLESLEFTFQPEESGKSIVFNTGLNDVPVQRNWRTNILGKILTGDIKFNVTIDPAYEEDINIFPPTPTYVSNWDEFTAALAEGASYIVLAGDITYSGNYDLKKNVTIDLNDKYLEISNPELSLSIHSTATITNGTIKGKVYARKTSDITFNEVTFGGTTKYSGSVQGSLAIQAGGTKVYAKKCIIDATTQGTSKTWPLSVEGTSSGTLKFEECTFKSNSNQNQVYVNQLSGTATLDFTNCNFNKTPNIDMKCEVLSNLTIKGNTSYGCTITLTDRTKDQGLQENELSILKDIKSNNGNKFTIGRLSFIILNCIAKQSIDGFYFPSVPGNFNGMSDGPFHTAGSCTVSLRNGRVKFFRNCTQ